MKIHTAFVLITATTCATALGCAGTGRTTSKDSSSGTARASLHRAKGCGDLLSDLKADATYKLNKGIDRQVESIQQCLVRSGGSESNCASYGGYYGGGFAERGSSSGAPVEAADAKSGAASPSAPAAGAANSTSAPAAASHSETNTQVQGVDEADFVKTDGANLYIIHGKAFKIVKAWPATDLKELSSLDIEGTPTEMFVEGGKVVVYSQVNGASLYAAAGIKPKNTYSDYSYAGVGSQDRGDAKASAGAPSGVSDPAAPVSGVEAYVPLTKMTVLTHNGVTAQVAREMYFEGSYLDSRRVGTHVRTVLSSYAHGPQIAYSVSDPNVSQPNAYPQTASAMIAALERLRTANKTSIDASQLNDWMPNTFTKNGAAVAVSSVACEDFYIPTTGTTESGLTEIASVDLANPTALPRESAILGRTETVYGSADTLYLAAQAWVEPPFSWQDGPVAASGGGSVAVASPPAPDTPVPAPSAPSMKSLAPRTTAPTAVTAWAKNKTHVHKFEFATDPGFPNYVASGTVVGQVKDKFSLDDRNGYLRIATSENRMYVDQTGAYAQPTFAGQTEGALDRPQTVNHVFVLGVNGAWLDTVGDVGDLAPNEQIYSVRFLEGRGYVVTFRRVDPLFVLDLDDPKAPKKLAELKIPGFSEYMHPLDATHLLTIGRDATGTGQAQGLQLQIFDVANGTNPILAHKFTYTGSEYGFSDAEHDAKAFTYFADKKLLAFPYFAYSQNGGAMHSSLELFSVNASSGFAKLGAIDHTDLVSKNPQGYCGGTYGPQVRRGVFLENFVFSISYGGIVAKDAGNLVGASAKLPFAAPQTNTGYGPPCAL